MQTFYLNIVNRIRVHIDMIMLFNIFSQTKFIFIFNIHKFLLCFCVVRISFQTFDQR